MLGLCAMLTGFGRIALEQPAAGAPDGGVDLAGLDNMSCCAAMDRLWHASSGRATAWPVVLPMGY